MLDSPVSSLSGGESSETDVPQREITLSQLPVQRGITNNHMQYSNGSVNSERLNANNVYPKCHNPLSNLPILDDLSRKISINNGEEKPQDLSTNHRTSKRKGDGPEALSKTEEEGPQDLSMPKTTSTEQNCSQSPTDLSSPKSSGNKNNVFMDSQPENLSVQKPTLPSYEQSIHSSNFSRRKSKMPWHNRPHTIEKLQQNPNIQKVMMLPNKVFNRNEEQHEQPDKILPKTFSTQSNGSFSPRIQTATPVFPNAGRVPMQGINMTSSVLTREQLILRGPPPLIRVTNGISTESYPMNERYLPQNTSSQHVPRQELPNKRYLLQPDQSVYNYNSGENRNFTTYIPSYHSPGESAEESPAFTVSKSDKHIPNTSTSNSSPSTDLLPTGLGPEQGSYPCPHCEKHFAYMGNLKRHIKMHHGEYRPYKCNLCVKRFWGNDSLEQHYKRVHCKDKPYACAHCEKKYSVCYDLQKHVRSVHGKDIDWEVSVPTKTMPSSDDQGIHRKKVTGIKTVHLGQLNYKCKFCNRGFATFNGLGVHLKMHFRCKVCLKGFNTEESLKTHAEKAGHEIAPINEIATDIVIGQSEKATDSGIGQPETLGDVINLAISEVENLPSSQVNHDQESIRQTIIEGDNKINSVIDSSYTGSCENGFAEQQNDTGIEAIPAQKFVYNTKEIEKKGALNSVDQIESLSLDQEYVL